MTWLFESKTIEVLPEDCVGFVYVITNNTTDKKENILKGIQEGGFTITIHNGNNWQKNSIYTKKTLTHIL